MKIKKWKFEKLFENTCASGEYKGKCFNSYALCPYPSYISICPNCNYPNVWSTTGVFPSRIDCKNCELKFEP